MRSICDACYIARNHANRIWINLGLLWSDPGNLRSVPNPVWHQYVISHHSWRQAWFSTVPGGREKKIRKNRKNQKALGLVQKMRFRGWITTLCLRHRISLQLPVGFVLLPLKTYFTTLLEAFNRHTNPRLYHIYYDILDNFPD